MSHSPHLSHTISNHPVKGSARIAGTGRYVPERILTNAELEQMVETSHEWILSRTGIQERRIAAPQEFTSHMATAAAHEALKQANIAPEALDLILVATVTPDTQFPSTACLVQRALGATHAAAFDVSAACSGFLYSLEIAHQFIATGTYQTVLVIGADKLSSIINWKDRNTCVLFGDGAGAAVLTSGNDSSRILSTYMASDGNFSDILYLPAGGCALPMSPEVLEARLHTLQMNGRETFKQAVLSMGLAARQALEQAGVSAEELTCVIPHQANIRIIDALVERLEIPRAKFMINLDKYGNTSAAAVAIALDEAHREGRFQRGELVLLVVFGGGLTYASCVIRW